MEELYFCLYLTENEHYIVEDDITDKCREYNCKLIYYRPLKEGHVPCYREVKITGNKPDFNKIKEYIKTLDPEPNPHKISKP